MKHLSTQAALMFMVAFFNFLQAQETSGIVKSEDQLPIANVSVIIFNKIITKTNSEGVFQLSDNYPLPIDIRLEHASYNSKSILFSKNNETFYLIKAIETESLNPILLTGFNDSEKKIILPLASIHNESLEQQSPVDIVSSLNQLPGIYVQSGAINTNRIVIRGVGSRTLYGTNKLRAYFDDIPITTGIGETMIDSYNPEDLQSITIIKGPKATVYGSSLGGVLLLQSQNPEQEGFVLKNSTTVGSFGLLKNSVSANYAAEKFRLHFSYDHLEVDGFRENSQYNRNSFFLNGSYVFSKKTELTVLMNTADFNAQIPSSIGKSAFETDPSQAAFTWKKAKGYEADETTLAGVSLKHRFSDDFQNSTSIFYSYTDHYEPRPFNILDEFTNRFGFRSVFTKKFDFLKSKGVWTFGSELNKDEYHWKTLENFYETNDGNGSLAGNTLSNNDEYRQQLNIFSSVKLPIYEKLTLEFGVNYNQTNYDFQDAFNLEDNNKSAIRNFDAILAPNLNVLYQFTGNHSMFANVSYGFNHPSLEESLTPEGISNPDIGPEKGYNYEIGTELYFSNRKWHVLTSLYLLDIKDLLVAQRVGDDQYIGRNAGQTIHKGIEISTDYKWIVSQSFSVSPYVNAAFDWHRFEEFVSDGIDFSGNKLTGVPDMTLASGMAFHFKNLSLYANHLYVGEMPMNDANSLFSDSYNYLNMKLTYTSQLFKRVDFKLNFGVNNLFDSQYASAILINATGFGNSEPRYYYPGNPRNYYGGVSLRYEL